MLLHNFHSYIKRIWHFLVLGTDFSVLLSSIYASRCWRIVHYQLWVFSNFSVLYSWTCYQSLDQDWRQKLEFFFPCLFSVCSKMCSSLVLCRKWQFSTCWRRSLRIHRLSLTFLWTMTVMWMHQIFLKGTKHAFYLLILCSMFCLPSRIGYRDKPIKLITAFNIMLLYYC